MKKTIFLLLAALIVQGFAGAKDKQKPSNTGALRRKLIPNSRRFMPNCPIFLPGKFTMK
ncbi:MAG: hypothetical protein LBB64_04380 [Dysgonamonadaceae bacterium]|jgi:hypothetical protein|nr:hypothetical protein [Dysgonamonadaceae bacterium]